MLVSLALVTSLATAKPPTCADELEACVELFTVQAQLIDQQEVQLKEYAKALKSERARSTPWLSPTTALLLGFAAGWITLEVVR